MLHRHESPADLRDTLWPPRYLGRIHVHLDHGRPAYDAIERTLRLDPIQPIQDVLARELHTNYPTGKIIHELEELHHRSECGRLQFCLIAKRVGILRR